MMNNELIPTPMMSFGESVKTCFQKYVTFKGRARRSEYWWFCLLNLIVSIVTSYSTIRWIRSTSKSASAHSQAFIR